IWGSGGLAPIPGMTRSPGLARGEVHGAAEVVMVLGPSKPAGLACGFARGSAERPRAVVLPVTITRIGEEKSPTAPALGTVSPGHASPPARGASSTTMIGVLALNDHRGRRNHRIRYLPAGVHVQIVGFGPLLSRR